MGTRRIFSRGGQWRGLKDGGLPAGSRTSWRHFLKIMLEHFVWWDFRQHLQHKMHFTIFSGGEASAPLPMPARAHASLSLRSNCSTDSTHDSARHFCIACFNCKLAGNLFQALNIPQSTWTATADSHSQTRRRRIFSFHLSGSCKCLAFSGAVWRKLVIALRANNCVGVTHFDPLCSLQGGPKMVRRACSDGVYIACRIICR